MKRSLAYFALLISACSPAPAPKAEMNAAQSAQPPEGTSSSSPASPARGDERAATCEATAEAMDLATPGLESSTVTERAKIIERIQHATERWRQTAPTVKDAAVRGKAEAYVSALEGYRRTLGMYTFVDADAPSKVLLPAGAAVARDDATKAARDFKMIDAGVASVPAARAAVTEARAQLRAECPARGKKD
jgi:hypothetical protein